MSRQKDPGMMLKEEKHLFRHLKHIDLVVEVLDARLPMTSRNLRIQNALLKKKRLVLLNKSDLADQKKTGQWLSYLAVENGPVLAFSSKSRQDLKGFEALLLKMRPKHTAFKRPLRLIVAGIPNVGKSSVINRLAHKLAARTGNVPGITRGAQWIRLRAGWEMLDTPGLLSPNLNPEKASPGLAVIGAIRSNVYETETVAKWLLSRILQSDVYFSSLLRFYRMEKAAVIETEDAILEHIGHARGLLGPGGEVSREKASQVLLKDFRKGALGRITLESPGEIDG